MDIGGEHVDLVSAARLPTRTTTMRVSLAPLFALVCASAIAVSAPFAALIPSESHSKLIRPLEYVDEPEVHVAADNVVKRFVRDGAKELCKLDTVYLASVRGVRSR